MVNRYCRALSFRFYALALSPMRRYSAIQKENITTAGILLLLTGLFISRAFLSMGMLLFIAAALAVNYEKGRLRRFKNNPVALACFVLFLITLVTGLWSSDTAEWWRRTEVKLPLLLLPLGFLYIRLSETAIFNIHLLFIFCVTGGTIYTVSEYWLNAEVLEAGYHQARVLPVLLDGDHIRFSWLVVIALLILLYIQKEILRRSFKIISWLLMGWLVVYLHILSAKTGLLLFYAAGGLWLLHQLLVQKKKWAGLALLGLLLLPFVAYKTVPTFKKRINYIRYDFSFYSTGQYRAGMSDGARVQSLKAGLQVWGRQPLAGVGFGDIEAKSNAWYAQQQPVPPAYERILPSSQLLLYAAGSGWLGLLAAIAALCWPLTKKHLRRDIYFIIFWIPASLSLLFEIHLEGQYGVFIFCFFACWVHLLASQLKKTA
jgi:O-antigen ligase